MSTPVSRPKRSRLLLGLVIFGVLVILCVLAYPFAKQTLPVEIIRSTIKRVPPAQLWADDLADDVRTKRRLAPLQDWAVQTLARYRSGQLATNQGVTFNYVGPSVKLDQKEVPSWLRGAWSGDPPAVSVTLSASNQPECIVVGWYLCGLLVGPTNYVTKWQSWYTVQVKPGIYAYSVEK
jgi:hypothetical protein